MKARIRKTGEIVDVISYSGNTTRSDVLDYVSYIDSNGKEHPNVNGINFYWDFEIIATPKNTYIDWEQRRYEIAKDVMQGILFGFQETREEIDNQCQGVAKASIVLADALIKELKGE